MAVTRTRPRALVHRLELRPQTKGVGVSLALLGFLSFRPSARAFPPSRFAVFLRRVRRGNRVVLLPLLSLSLTRSPARALVTVETPLPFSLSALSLLSAPRYATQCCRCSPLCSASPPDCVRFLPWNKSMGRGTFKCILSLTHIHTYMRARTHNLAWVV